MAATAEYGNMILTTFTFHQLSRNCHDFKDTKSTNSSNTADVHHRIIIHWAQCRTNSRSTLNSLSVNDSVTIEQYYERIRTLIMTDKRSYANDKKRCRRRLLFNSWFGFSLQPQKLFTDSKFGIEKHKKVKDRNTCVWRPELCLTVASRRALPRWWN